MRKNKYKPDPSLENIGGPSVSSFDQVNKYGTYNIQPTADTDNEFPAIAQGLAKSHNRKTNNSKKA